MAVDIVAYIGEGLVEDGEEHVDEDVGYGDGVAEKEEGTEERTGELHRKEVKSSQHHLKKKDKKIMLERETLQFSGNLIRKEAGKL